MQLIDGVLGFFCSDHCDKREATMLTRRWIGRNVHIFHLPAPPKHILQASLIHFPWNTQNKEASSTAAPG